MASLLTERKPKRKLHRAAADSSFDSCLAIGTFNTVSNPLKNKNEQKHLSLMFFYKIIKLYEFSLM